MRTTAETLRPTSNEARASHLTVVRVPSTDIVSLRPVIEKDSLIPPDYKALGIQAPEERSFNRATLNTSYHEWQHGHVIRKLGHKEKLARAEVGRKVIQEGVSYGRTIVYGTLPPVDLVIALAAGSIHTPEGNAWGTDMDQKMANELIAKHGGITWEEAKEKARDYILELTDDERMIAARIVDSMKIVDGSLFDNIINVARWEAVNARDIALKLPERQETEEETATTPIYGAQTVIEELPSGVVRVRYIFVDEDGKEHPLCPKCQCIDGHAEDCINLLQPSHEKQTYEEKNEAVVFTRPGRKLSLIK